jgi:nucleoside-diphosphate-sugar epimerase
MSTLLVTGVTGFVGSHIAAELGRRGHRVIGSTSSEAGLRIGIPGVERVFVLKLQDQLDPAIAQSVDAVIHCAWDLRPGTSAFNVTGTQRLVDAARRAGAVHQLFISSCSAHPAAVTEYGKTKLVVQESMLAGGHAVVRLGITIGHGGIYRRMSDTLARHRVVPLIDGGRGLVPIVAIADLDKALAAIVEGGRTGLFNLFNPELVPLRDLMFEMRRLAPHRAMLVPVPASALLAPLWLARKIGVKLPLDADNVRALRANYGVRDRSDLTAFVPSPMSLSQMVRAAASEEPTTP